MNSCISQILHLSFKPQLSLWPGQKNCHVIHFSFAVKFSDSFQHASLHYLFWTINHQHPYRQCLCRVRRCIDLAVLENNTAKSVVENCEWFTNADYVKLLLKKSSQLHPYVGPIFKGIHSRIYSAVQLASGGHMTTLCYDAECCFFVVFFWESEFKILAK